MQVTLASYKYGGKIMLRLLSDEALEKKMEFIMMD